MNEQIRKSHGVAILASVLLLTFTVGLHPAGGGIEHLVRITPLIVATHTVAIISVPVMLYGVWGLADRLGFDSGLSLAGLITFAMGMFAVLIAAALNGLALPFFVNGLDNADAKTLEAAGLILNYGFAVNQAFDVIFVIFLAAAVIIWSIAILLYRRLPVWLGAFGLIAGVLALVALVSGVALTHLRGFRFFMAGFIVWLILLGIQLLRPLKNK